MRYLPALASLHARHLGLSPAICRCFAEAARVCLDRHHSSPVLIEVNGVLASKKFHLSWRETSDRVRSAWANDDDATRDGAYSVCIASIEAVTGLVAVSRAEVRRGADYYLGAAASTDFEKSYRLEVSGTDRGSRPDVAHRLKEKVAQARAGDSDLPAFAVAVGFKELVVMYAAVED